MNAHPQAWKVFAIVLIVVATFAGLTVSTSKLRSQCETAVAFRREVVVSLRVLARSTNDNATALRLRSQAARIETRYVKGADCVGG